MTVLTDICSFHRIVMETHILDSLVTLTSPSNSNYMYDFTDVNTRKCIFLTAVCHQLKNSGVL